MSDHTKEQPLGNLKVELGADISEFEAAMARVKTLLIEIEKQAERTAAAVCRVTSQRGRTMGTLLPPRGRGASGREAPGR